MKAKDLDLFKNLCDWDLNPDEYWDLHNDFECVRIINEKGLLKFVFKSISDATNFLYLEFMDTELTHLDLSLAEPLATLTLDNVYRGRFQVNGDLIEFDQQQRGYFYLEFYEGPMFEFWSSGVSLIKIQV